MSLTLLASPGASWSPLLKERVELSGLKKKLGIEYPDVSFERLPPVVTLTSEVVWAARSRTKRLLDPNSEAEAGLDGGLPVRSVAESLKATSLPSGLKV